MVVAHNGLGVFVVPVWPGQAPSILKVSKRKKKGPPRVPVPWFDYLLSRSLLQFDLHRDAFYPYPGDYGMTVVVAKFDYTGRLKSKRRPERHLSVPIVASLRPRNGMLGTIPCALTRTSPLADALGPTAASDRMPDEGPARSSALSPPRAARPKWARGVIARWGATYPFRDVAQLAVQVSSTGVDPFVGAIDKCVSATSRLDEEEQLQCRSGLLDEVAVGRMWGPSPVPPFLKYHICPLFSLEKKKHDPLDVRRRLVSNFSKFGSRGSVNLLCWSPRLISFHCRPHHIRDRIASCGRGARAWTADIPKCFRQNVNHERLLPLFVYRLLISAHGEEFFCDLVNPFDWTPAEWGWQCVLAIIRW